VPSIEKVLEEFPAETIKKLKPKTAAGYRDVIQLFDDYYKQQGAISSVRPAL
jgi:hypothetical protein